jgi:archaellin
LQQKSLTTGKQTQQEVSSGIQIVTLTGTNGSNGDLEDYEMLVKLTAGSDALSLNETLVTLDTKTTTQNLRYVGIYPDSGSGASVNYTAEYLKNGTDHLDNYLTTGDIVKLRFSSTNSITQSATVKLRVIPKHGVIVPVDFVTPDVISTQRVILYP